MLIQFLNNKDKKTTTFLADHMIINDEIPYVPELLVDHRGLNLYLFCKEADIAEEELEFGVETENYEELQRGFQYMFDPIYVRQNIEEREKNRRPRRW